MQTATFRGRRFLTVLSSILVFQFMIFTQSCKKTTDLIPPGENSNGNGNGRGPKNPPPPPPPPFYFSNCYNPLYSATLVKGQPANVAISKTYINSPGGSYGAFTSATVNGITVTAPAGTFNVGSGTVTFTATGTALNSGIFYINHLMLFPRFNL